MALPSSETVSNEVNAKRIAPLFTPHWGSQSGSAFTILATIAVKASPHQVRDALLDTRTWSEWNNFVPRATLTAHDGQLRPGILFKEHVDMRGQGKNTIVKMKLLMTALDIIEESGRNGFKVVWLGKGYPDWALRSERVHEIYRDANDESTLYNVYETFSGPLAWAVKVLFGKTLVNRFGQWNSELKAFVEEGSRRSQNNE